MRRWLSIILLIIIPVCTVLAAGPGRIDVSDIPLHSYRELTGDWAFWWNRFLDPGTAGAGDIRPDAYVPFPGEWKNFPPTGGSSVGYATLHVEITGLSPGRDWAVKLSSILSAARMYVNGVLILSFGTPGVDSASERPEWGSRVIRILPGPGGKADIVLQISNFHDRAGGSRTPILIGDYEEVAGAQNELRLFELFLFGAISVMGLYFLSLFAFRPVDRSSLFFGLLCLALALRTVCYDEYYIRELIPGLSWDWLFRLGYIMFPLPVLFFVSLVRSLFPKSFPGLAFIAIAAACAAYAVLFAAAPTLFMARSLVGFQMITVVSGLFIFYVLARAAIGREPGSVILALGFVLFFGSALHDILIASGVIRGVFVVQFGLLALLFSMSIVITRKFAAAFSRAESLSAELVRTNKALKRFVPEEFLSKLGKSTIEQVSLGDHAAMDMTVMFADIRQFSLLSERLSPEDTFRFLNQYLARMGPAVRDHGGFVDKYIGDGIMALFPGSPEDAVRCAIELQSRLRDYNGLRAASGEAAIKIGIGIHTGRLMLGTIGENERMDGTVISDAVNIASRIEGITKEFSIGLAVSERILAGVKDRNAYLIRFLGKVGLKGKREPVSVFEIFNGDPDPLRERKCAIIPRFEKALADFYAQDFPMALSLFNEVLAEVPEDDASAHYVRLIRKLSMA